MSFCMIRRSLAAALLGLATLLAAAKEPKVAHGWQPPLAEIEALLRAQLFDPALLDSPAYAELRSDLRALVATAPARDDFIETFNQRWLRGPSSHVRLQWAPVNAAQLAAQLDGMNAGAQAVQLRWEGETAVLAVHTMMGRDTERAISEAYRAIVERPARAVVIDLRQNTGGAFAVRPLVGHLLARGVDSGVFISRRWTGGAAPSREEVNAVAPWDAWSLRRFWVDVQAQAFTRVRFTPMAPHYGGPVIVLTSAQTASAAELAIDALLGAGRVRVLGERSAGRMLSQAPFDVSDGLLLFVPVADYHAWHSGRIEGRGIEPNRVLSAVDALPAALAELSR